MSSLLELFATSKPKSLKKNQVILTPGQDINTIFYIITGRIKMYSVAKSGQETILHIFEQKGYLPIMTVLSGKPNTYYFEATEATQVYTASKQLIIDYLKNHPEEMYELSTRLSKAILGLLTRVENLATLSVKKQIASLHELSARHSRSPKSHQEIANWLGVSRETVSRNHK